MPQRREYDARVQVWETRIKKIQKGPKPDLRLNFAFAIGYKMPPYWTYQQIGKRLVATTPEPSACPPDCEKEIPQRI